MLGRIHKMVSKHLTALLLLILFVVLIKHASTKRVQKKAENKKEVEKPKAGDLGVNGLLRRAVQLPIKPPIQKVPGTKDRWTRWTDRSCDHLQGLLDLKKRIMNRLNQGIEAVKKKKDATEDEKKFEIHTFVVFQRELNDSETAIFQAVHSLKHALSGNYRDISYMREASLQRLDALKAATLQEEEEYSELVRVENKVQEQAKKANSSTFLEEILADVAKAADKLEETLQEHVFDESKKAQGALIEAVVRVNEDPGKVNDSKSGVDDGGMSMLVDSRNNQYILTKAKDSTTPLAHKQLIQDMILILSMSFLWGWLCNILHLPTLFGYVMTGLVLGPAGLNIIKAVVQVETLGEFGVFFILFTVGMEFSPDKLRKTWKVAVLGSLAMMLLMVLCGILWGIPLAISWKQSVFVSACLSLSSTPLVVRFLSTSARSDHKYDDPDTSVSSELDYSSILLGILVMQDVMLGLIMAILPTLAPTGPPAVIGKSGTDTRTAWDTVKAIMSLVEAVIVVLGLSFVLSKYVMAPFFRRLHLQGSKEMLLMGTVALCFLMLQLTDVLGVSMEVGCFLAGVLVSSQGHQVVEELLSLIDPVKDIFASIFFATIGLHVFPTFVVYELSILAIMTLVVVSLKFIVGVAVLGLFLTSRQSFLKWLVAAGLAQVSEFSFVLGSRARRLGIISREVYLLVLGVTTLSLLLAPALWQLSLWRFRVIRRRSYSGPQIT
ncbi:PREDICTED: transmembrane and coiled-coil domain-containing protein 3-like [Branchiostoma belcheri]|uniref:Transmembrane and coiled-coil domain-containing protein 3-like n=1 Tax=Branchiostoma belcheri TaxID=7741 RepID=A0A6P4XY33_BRABE|nr:PREDICTED: transmembrane and coiled-coil domain-containing protein 3-like [Branchiostoma belcheri]XP_019617033.1 PREDICTED: transmembrane and coiled-coil domain-containing protein 3-like [Branchiostoma belcheri]XP_019617034.1 PREDICTED: transmembrane and coiled-coil domain-containing protein 3-like [Branchiostoma belcheri]XP_019617035.1 PREDICTED: transmembrane and coiled-coil domain-containing protein 3-like [Branchiostoma belcheri]